MIFFILVVIAAILLAKTEIEIEGKDGYSKNLPLSWRAKNRWLRLFIVGSSYHLYMGLFLVTLVHLPFAIYGWTLRGEFLALSFLGFVTVAEDFLWFVLNPHYGIKKYRRECIPWFKDFWLWICPAWYFWYIPVSIVFYIYGRL